MADLPTPKKDATGFGCEKCEGEGCDAQFSVGNALWGVCLTHQVKWFVGYDVTPGWKTETVDQWDHNRRFLANFTETGSMRLEPEGFGGS